MELWEKFSWPSPEWVMNTDLGKTKVRIKGIAARANITSRNNRKYVDEELHSAARTFIERPVTVNHDPKKEVGKVIWMEYEDGALEYIADIWKQPYVDLIRSKSAEIRGVSIEADYLHNKCPKCGDKFYAEQDFRDHMDKTHFIKIDANVEPHGMRGKALSLVLTPEVPGIPGTTIELVESKKEDVKGFDQLLELIIQESEERERVMSAKVEPKPVEKAAADVPYLVASPRMEAKEVAGAAPILPKADAILSSASAQPPAASPSPPAVPLSDLTFTLPTLVTGEKLTLGEPIVGYDSWEDCVAKNADKEDPEAYCAQIERDTGGEMMRESPIAKEAESKIAAIQHEMEHRKLMEANRVTRGEVFKARRDILQVKKAVEVTHGNAKTIAETRQRDIVAVNEALTKTAKATTEALQQALTESVGKVNEQLAAVSAKLVESEKATQTLRTENATLKEELRKYGDSAKMEVAALKEQVAAQPKPTPPVDYAPEFAKLREEMKAADGDRAKDLGEALTQIDEKYKAFKKETDAKIAEKDAKIAELEKNANESEVKKLKETEQSTTRLDNVEAGLKKLAQFKGVHPVEGPGEGQVNAFDPYASKKK